MAQYPYKKFFFHPDADKLLQGAPFIQPDHHDPGDECAYIPT